MKYYKKIILKIEMKNKVPIHIGSGDEFYSTCDLPIAYNGEGNPYVPATSFVGAIRDYLDDLYSENDVSMLLGVQDADKMLSIKSFLIVEDTIFRNYKISKREHNGIKSGTQITAQEVKFNEELIEAGANLDVLMELNIQDEENEKSMKGMMYDIYFGIKSGFIKLGGKTTRGFGTLSVNNVKVKEYKIFKSDGLMSFIKDSANFEERLDVTTLKDWENKAKVKKEKYFMCISMRYKLTGSFLSGSYDKKEETDIAPLFSKTEDGHELPVVPGSSLKGIFRERADMIIRTFCENDLQANYMLKIAEKNSFANEHSKEKASNKYLLKLFGNFIDYKKELSEKDCEKEEYLAGRGKLQINDSFVYHDKDEEVTVKNDMHVKIDRFSGGALNGALYEVGAVSGENLFMNLDLIINDPELWEIGLIGNVLKDFGTGDLRVGYGTKKGNGAFLFDKILDFQMNVPKYNMSLNDVYKKDNKSDFSEMFLSFLNAASESFNNKIIGV